MRGALLVALLAALSAAQDAAEGEWIQHFDTSSGKHFYYHSITRETAWEAPSGAKVKFITEGSNGEGSNGASGGTGKGGGASSFWVMMGLLCPILLPMLGLLACYWNASNHGLADALKSLKKVRDRTNKRRSTKAGGNFRQRHKLSQDGKGGRSANS
jgi:hypothetical protein